MSIKHVCTDDTIKSGIKWRPGNTMEIQRPVISRQMILSVIVVLFLHTFCLWWLAHQINRTHVIPLSQETTTQVQITMQSESDEPVHKTASSKQGPLIPFPAVLTTEQGERVVPQGAKEPDPVIPDKKRASVEKPKKQNKVPPARKLIAPKSDVGKPVKNQHSLTRPDNKRDVAPHQPAGGTTESAANNNGKIISKQAMAGSKGVSKINCQINQPDYPRIARRKGLEGEVRLQVLLAADGQITRVTIQKSSGDEEMDDAASEAVRHAKCQPWIDNGQAIPVSALQSVFFKLNQ